MAITMSQRATSIVVAVTLLGLTFIPVAVSAVSDSANTSVSASIGSTITITTSTTVAMTVTPVAGGAVSSASDSVVVNTNNPSGYTLELASADTNTNLVSGGNNIASHAGTHGTPTTLANNTWGYRIVSQGGFGGGAYSGETDNASSTSTWAGVASSASPTTIKITAAPASNDTTAVWYGLKATSSQPNGTYTDTVTYTATTN